MSRNPLRLKLVSDAINFLKLMIARKSTAPILVILHRRLLVTFLSRSGIALYAENILNHHIGQSAIVRKSVGGRHGSLSQPSLFRKGLKMRSISEWQKYVMEWCEQKGWNKNLTIPAMIANLHSEVSEAWEEYRSNWELTDVHFEHNPEVPVSLKPEGFSIELADLFIRLVHLCEVFNIDLESAVELKMKYNESRPYRHGGKKA